MSKIFEAKGRPQDNPLIVHIASLEDLPPLVEQVPPMAEKLAQAFWPGPLTMVFRKSPRVPQEITAGLETVAIRMPQHPAARDVIRAAGVPLAAPSANRSGKPSPTTAAHVMEDMKGRIEAVLDGGECSVGVESTVVDMTGDVPRILRPGAITQKQLKRVLGKNVEIDEAVFHEVAPGQPVRSPGMKYRHYAPKAPVLLFVGAPDVTARAIEQEMQPHDAVLCFDEYHDFYDDEKGPVRTYGPSCDKQAQGQQLFAVHFFVENSHPKKGDVEVAGGLQHRPQRERQPPVCQHRKQRGAHKQGVGQNHQRVQVLVQNGIVVLLGGLFQHNLRDGPDEHPEKQNACVKQCVLTHGPSRFPRPRRPPVQTESRRR